MSQGEKSESMTVTVGVPRGSILGPLLFILYINNLPEVPDQSIHMYADDSTLQIIAKDLSTIVRTLT